VVVAAAHRPKNTIPTTATPSALPTCWAVERTPETARRTSGSTSPMAASIRAVSAIPIPRPASAEPGDQVDQRAADAVLATATSRAR
jgi:hypothetical protein